MPRSPLIDALFKLYALGRPHRRLLWTSFAFMAVVGATTGAYAWLMGPALRFLLTGGAEGLGPVARVWPSLASLDRDRALWVLPIAAVVIGAVKGVAYLGQFYTVGLFGQHVVVDLRRLVFRRLLGLSPRQLSGQLSGDLLGRFSADVAAVELAATYTLASYFRDTLQILILVAVAFSLTWKLTLVLLVAVPLAAWPAARLTRSLLARLREGQTALGALSGQVHEGVGALRTLQAFNAKPAELERFDRKAFELQRSLERAGWTRGATPGVMEVLAALSIAAVLSLSAGYSLAQPEALISFVAAIVLAYQPAKDLGRLSGFGLQAAAALERLNAVLSTVPAVPEPDGAKTLPPLSKGLRLDDVRFDWADGRKALDGATLEVPAGQTVALVGPSGGGKSTLVGLLLGFVRPTTGTVTVDGTDLSELDIERWRRRLAWVPQRAHLFAATLAENIALGTPGLDRAAIEAAARSAYLGDVIDSLPLGLDTPLGERGVGLSSGERQRLALARAFARTDADLILLDEPTARLDGGSEQAVIDATARLVEGRTAIFVAHRPAMLDLATRVIEVADGRVRERVTA